MKILFTSINQQPIAIKLIAVGEPTIGSNKYTTDTLTSSQNYTMGDWIISESGFINFDYRSTSVNESNYCQFVTSGADIAISGHFDGWTNYCYYNMFKDSKNIVDASNIQFDRFGLGKHSAENMFMNCTSLTATPTVFSNIVDDWCYAGMFFGCTSLKYASCELEGLRIGTYSWMFMNCTSLTGIAGLPSQTNAKPLCYNSMFQNCILLSTAPQIPITKFDTGCLKNMFMGCKNLNNITVNFTDWNSNNIIDATENWVKGVASNGRFNKPNALTEEYSVDRIPIGWDRSFETITIDQIPTIEFGSIYNKVISSSITEYVHYSGVYPLIYMINGSLPRGVRFNNGVFECETIKIQQSESKIVNLIVFAADAKPVMANIQIKTTYNEWVPLTFKLVGQPAYLKLALIHAGNETSDVALNYKLNNGDWTTYNINNQIELHSGDTIAFSGSTEHFSTGLNNNYYFIKDAVGSNPFYLEVYGNIQSLVNYREFLVDDYQYAQLFSPLGLVNDASKLILPNNTTSHCYEQMFKNCNYLTAVPQLPATELNQSCYSEMFRHCISLSTASTISATTLAPQCCKGMFYECTSLIEAPALPATQLATSCYSNMFQYCYNLKEAPVLPASTLVIDCYNRMFDNCSSLSSINVSFISWNVVNGTSYWVNNVAQSGVFTKPSVLPEQYNPSRIPEGWRVINTYSETINIDPIPSIRYYNNSSSVPVSTDIREYVHYTGSRNLSYQISGTLPEGLTFSNGVFNCIPNSISEDQTVEVNVIVSALDAAPVTANITFELFAIDYRTLPLTFKALVSSNIGLSGVGEVNPITMYFKKNNDVDWTSYTVGDSISLSQGDIVSFSGTTSGMNTSESIHYKFISTVDNSLNVYGSIQSLVNGAEQLSSIEQYGCLFRNNKAVVDASNMILPNNTTNNCYRMMFFNCSYLTGTPTLPANTLAVKCYQQMFAGCGSLLDTPQLYAENLDQFCYDGMFQGCTNLTGASPLPATVLKRSCYGTMFYNCKNLLTAPTIGGRTLEQYCYNEMFRNCTSLTSAPELPATTLADRCYKQMFDGCSSLISAPALPATGLASYCYDSMFKGCSHLTDAPSLPATTITDRVYQNMFLNCTSLTSAPDLPASSLFDFSYLNMFQNCTSLSTGPNIFATTFRNYSCQGMFKGCTNLNAITVQFEEWNPSGAFLNWVQNVAATGTFTKPSGLSEEYGDSRIPTNWGVQEPVINPLTFKGLSNSNAVQLQRIGSPSTIVLDYSKNNGPWTTYNVGDIIEFNQGETVAFKGVNDHFSRDNSSHYRFYMSGSIEASGNIQSLMNFIDSCTDFCYQSMFYNCSSLITAPQLPATTLAPSCYWRMFAGCSALTSAPSVLPATTLANGCYYLMFNNCKALKTAPQLPASSLTLYCYRQMFSGCISLTSAPALPATGLHGGCYSSMFSDCRALSTAPQLPVTTLVDDCYANMFSWCISLTSAPALPATTLANGCYYGMFSHCTSLSSIEVAFTNWTEAFEATYNWVGSITTSGTFYKPSALNAEYGNHRIPINWQVINKDQPLTFKGLSNSNAVQLTKLGSPSAIVLDYSKNNGSWTTYNIGDVIELNQNDTVAFSGANDHFSKSLNDYYRFAMSGTIEASGNIQSLMNFSDYCKSNCFNYLFIYCDSLIKAPRLPVKNLVYNNASYCYYGLFAYCTNLSTAPELPATELADRCYSWMFLGCTSLTAAPLQLPATTLAPYCYAGMFEGCTSLTSFRDNTWSGISLVDHCFYRMFYGCSNLSSIYIQFSDWKASVNATKDWVSGVAVDGTFTKSNNLSEQYGTSYIPVGWTVTYISP